MVEVYENSNKSGEEGGRKTLRTMKNLLPILVLDIFLAGFMPVQCPAGDLNRVPLVINEFMASNNNSAQDLQDHKAFNRTPFVTVPVYPTMRV